MQKEISFEVVLHEAMKLPLIYVDRDEFLRRELIKVCSGEETDVAILKNPASAGISMDKINKLAEECISYEAVKVSAISFATGIPGGLAMFGTVPADLIQYMGHILVIIQKLAYLYGWDDLIQKDQKVDDGTESLLILFVGIMFGVNGATAAISKIVEKAAQKIEKDLINKALTKGTIYPIVKQVARSIGIKMTKEIFAKNVSKIVPIVGGVVSGGLTYVTFTPMAYRLKGYLAGLKYCNPDYYDKDIID